MLVIVMKAMKMGNLALRKERPFDAYLAYSIGIWFSLQTAVNVGASAGILPTKGLTFPLLSYGGSSMIVMAVAVAILVRFDFEMRVDGIQAINKAGAAKGKKRTLVKKAKQQVNMVIEDVIDEATLEPSASTKAGGLYD
jgi:cell division protein FtsW